MQILQQVKDKFQTLQADFKKAQVESDSFSKIVKSQVLQDSRCFNNAQLNAKQCRQISSKLIYLINQGQAFTDQESSSLFFSITKLFQSNDKDLRRMIYLMIKEFRDENVMYIVTQSLMKDITSSNDLYRMNALRTIPLVLDPSNLIQVERYIKMAILDKNYAIVSAALLASIQLFSTNSEIVKKFTSEILSVLNSKNTNNHFHAIILLHEIKKQDKNSFTKILVDCTKDSHNSLATMQIIRFIKEALQTGDLDASSERIFIDYLNRQVHKSNEMTVFEACKTLCELNNLSNKDLVGAISVLGIFLIGSNSINKFVTLRILNKLVSNPVRKSLIQNKADIEAILTDNNKSLSSLAVSLLLKVCSEDNIDSLLTQIYDNLEDMSDEFKIDILRSVRNLVKNIPKRAKAVLGFLFNCLKNDGNQEFKKYAIEIIEQMIQEIPESRDQGLLVLAEYIEDCLFNNLQLQVLSILNREASKQAVPQRIIRFINNRIHLEEPEVRAAAVGTIFKFGYQQPQIKSNVVSLLKQTLDDPDEEVRERAFQNINLLEQNDNSFLVNQQKNLHNVNLQEIAFIEKYIQMNIETLSNTADAEALQREKILEYAQQNNFQVEEQQVQKKQSQSYQEHLDFENEKAKQDTKAAPVVNPNDDSHIKQYSKLFSESPVFSQYGQLRSALNGGNLTDKDSEYQVSYYKYFFDNYVVLEYIIKNTVQQTTLKNVKVDVQLNSEFLKVAHIVPANEIKENETSNVLVGIARHPEHKMVAVSAQNFLHFVVCEMNGNQVAAQYSDECQIDDLNITVADHLNNWDVKKGKFETEWEYLNGEESQQTFQLSYKNTDFAIKEIVKHFNVSVCDGTDVILQNSKDKFHTLKIAGLYQNNVKFMIVFMIAFDLKIGCVLKMRVKCEDEEVAESLISAFAQ